MKPTVSPPQDLKKPDPSRTSLHQAVQIQLKEHTESPYNDGLVLLSHITGLSKSQILSNPNPGLTPEQENKLEQALEDLKSGTPLPYILGEWEFYKLIFKITPDVLIPRPETEGLVEIALRWLERNPAKRTCLEIGTGSGCIAVSLAKTIPNLKITATDISAAALRLARENAGSHQVQERITFLEGDLLKWVPGKTDLLIANLPYIPTSKLAKLAVSETEPRLALDGGPDGLHYIGKLLKNAGDHINPGGAIFLELDEDCGAAALSLAKDYFPGLTLKLDQDLSGLDRYLSIEK